MLYHPSRIRPHPPAATAYMTNQGDSARRESATLCTEAREHACSECLNAHRHHHIVIAMLHALPRPLAALAEIHPTNVAPSDETRSVRSPIDANRAADRSSTLAAQRKDQELSPSGNHPDAGIRLKRNARRCTQEGGRESRRQPARGVGDRGGAGDE
jgi:hypothetical protein